MKEAVLISAQWSSECDRQSLLGDLSVSLLQHENSGSILNMSYHLSMCGLKTIFENQFRVGFGEKVSVFGSASRSSAKSCILGLECYFTFDIEQIHQMRHIFSPDRCPYLRQCCQLPRRDTLMKHFTDLAWIGPTCLLGVDIYLYFISLHHWFVSKLNKYFSPVCNLFCWQVEQMCVCLAQNLKLKVAEKKLIRFSFCRIVRIPVSVRLPAHAYYHYDNCLHTFLLLVV